MHHLLHRLNEGAPEDESEFKRSQFSNRTRGGKLITKPNRSQNLNEVQRVAETGKFFASEGVLI